MKIYQGTVDIAGDNQLTSVKVNSKELLSRPISFTNGNNLLLKLKALIDPSVYLKLVNQCSLVQIVDKATNEDDFCIESLRIVNRRNGVTTITNATFDEVSEIDYTPEPVAVINSKLDSNTVSKDEFNELKSSVENIGDVSAKADKTYVDTQLATKQAKSANLDAWSSTTKASMATAASVTPKADKTYVDTQDALKANSADVYAKTETYNKTEVDSALALKQDKA